MQRDRVRELHFICPFENVPSVIARGILCKRQARRLNPAPLSVADESVQSIRAGVRVPNGESLHSFTNLPFDARNTMMSKLRHLNDSLAIVRVDHHVLDSEGVIVADRNAASGAAIFRSAAEGLPHLVEDEVSRNGGPPLRRETEAVCRGAGARSGHPGSDPGCVRSQRGLCITAAGNVPRYLPG